MTDNASYLEHYMKVTVTVETNNFEVDQWYYSFDYKIKVNNKVVCKSRYENDHGWPNSKRWFKNRLKEGWAASTVFEEIVPSVMLANRGDNP